MPQLCPGTGGIEVNTDARKARRNEHQPCLLARAAPTARSRFRLRDSRPSHADLVAKALQVAALVVAILAARN